MRGRAGTLASLLRPVLDTYRDSAVTVAGCNALGIQRDSCELDVIVVTDEPRAESTLKSGETYFDVYFMSEKEVLRPADSELAVSVAQSKPIRDSNLILSTAVAANQAVLGASIRRSAQNRLTSSVKGLGRAEDMASRGHPWASNYWLLSASYDFAASWLYTLETVPSPSHLLMELRGVPSGSPKNFEAFSKGAGLAMASRRECARRLEAVSVLYDLLSAGRVDEGGGGAPSSAAGYQVVRRKTSALAEEMDHAESYSYLGLEVVRMTTAVSRARGPAPGGGRMDSTLRLLQGKDDGVLSERLLADMGLTRPMREISEAIAALRDRVATLARRI